MKTSSLGQRHFMRARALALALALRAVQAHADPTHYNQVLVGGQALGMAGAATGLADDSASVYYNPAGIGMLPGSSASASFQLRAFEKIKVGGALSAARLGDLESDSSPTRAVYASAIAKVGDKDANGFRRHALAFSIVHPDQEQISFSGQSHQNNDYAGATVLMSDDTVWTGASYAYASPGSWSLGLSLFWAQREYSHRESWLGARNVVPRDYVDPDGNTASAFAPDQLVASIRQVKLTANSVVVRLGTRLDLTPNWRLGLMLQPPGIALSANADVSEQRLSQNMDAPGAPFATYYQSSQRTNASWPIPWQVRLGGAYASETFTADLDVLLHGPTGSASSPVDQVSAPAADTYFGTPPRFPFLFAPQYYTNFTVNVALGVEGLIGRVVPWSAGVFTDRSAAPNITQPSTTYALQHVNRYGVTASGGWRDLGYDLLIGGAFIFGSGNALVPDLGAVGYSVSDWKERSIVFFLSGQKSALKRAAKAAANLVKPASEPESEPESESEPE
jgi:long-subunit fatty acid transport protein